MPRFVSIANYSLMSLIVLTVWLGVPTSARAQGAVQLLWESGQSAVNYAATGSTTEECDVGTALGLFRCLVEEGLLLMTELGIVAIHYLVDAIVPLLTSGFMTHPFVLAGWPFILGIANLGFMLALLFIAVVTILRLEGFSTRRMLVRLLIAAVLINFSLLIAGVILDVSRLSMAVIYRAMAGGDNTSGDIRLLSTRLLRVPGLFQQIWYQKPDAPWYTAFLGSIPLVGDDIKAGIVFGVQAESLVFLLMGAVLIWAYAIALLILVIGLLGRYIMLIFLFIISPLAYLFYAMPMADRLARQWWTLFLKYVVYGPIVVFMLSILGILSDPSSNGTHAYIIRQFPGLFGEIAFIVLTIAMLVLTARVGRVAGGAAGAFIQGRLEAAGRFARQHPIIAGAAILPFSGGLGAAAGVGAGAVAGAGTALAGVGIGKTALGFGKKVAVHYAADKIAAERKVASKVATGEMSEEEYKKTRKEHPVGAALGKAAGYLPFGGGAIEPGKSPYLNYDKDLADVKTAIKQGGAGSPFKSIKDNPMLDPRRLARFIDDLDAKELVAILEEGNHDQKEEILEDPEAIQTIFEKDPSRRGITVIEDIRKLPTKQESFDSRKIEVEIKQKMRAAGQDPDGAHKAIFEQNYLDESKIEKQRLDQHNSIMRANKELVDAALKGQREYYKKYKKKP